MPIYGYPRTRQGCRAKLGWIGAWAAVLGLVLPGCLAFLIIRGARGGRWEAGLGAGYAIVGLCIPLFVILELVALVCGLAAWFGARDKAGPSAASSPYPGVSKRVP
jgi:hypothetical protein